MTRKDMTIDIIRKKENDFRIKHKHIDEENRKLLKNMTEDEKKQLVVDNINDIMNSVINYFFSMYDREKINDENNHEIVLFMNILMILGQNFMNLQSHLDLKELSEWVFVSSQISKDLEENDLFQHLHILDSYEKSELN